MLLKMLPVFKLFTSNNIENKGFRLPTLNFHFPTMSQKNDFFERVYNVVRQVPYGRVTTYGAVARFLGATKSARTVGYAMNAAHNLEGVPAHRVVNRIGLLTGKHHFGGINTMQQLLESEGHTIVNDQIQGFEAVLWSPNE